VRRRLTFNLPLGPTERDSTPVSGGINHGPGIALAHWRRATRYFSAMVAKSHEVAVRAALRIERVRDGRQRVLCP
jgi:hypothetical protein